MDGFYVVFGIQRTAKEVLERSGGGHGLQSRNEITKSGGGRETRGKHCLLQNFAWSLLIIYSTRKRQNFPASHPWVQILALPILAGWLWVGYLTLLNLSSSVK